MAAVSLPPVVLDVDGSVGKLPHEIRLPLAAAWQERMRFGCGLRTMRAFRQALEAAMPAVPAHGTVFMGSGDFHHLSWPLIERCIAAHGFSQARPLQVMVLDNHPDNMRFPFGVHCGSWVRRVAMMPQVAHVHVAGITSGDIGMGHAWENYLGPLRAGRLTYWSSGVDTRWARWLGIADRFRTFPDADALVEALTRMLERQQMPTYLSIDKDVFSRRVVQTNWDQGTLEARHAATVIAGLRGRIVGSDVTGDVSTYRYAAAWKRWLSAGDGQQTGEEQAHLPAWQAAQAAFNVWLLDLLEVD